MEKHQGYHFGLKPGLELLHLAKEYGIKEITYYGFTTDNCKRPAKQLEAFSKSCVEAVQLIAADGVSLLVVGNSQSPAFPSELKPYTVRTDINGGGIKVNFLVNYGIYHPLVKMGTVVKRSLKTCSQTIFLELTLLYAGEG